jgi:hypothetical protein
LKLIPALTFSERYDSNVFFATTGSGREDFVSTLTPELRTEYKGRAVEADLTGLLLLNSFSKNNKLNYVAASGVLSLNLTPLVARLNKHARLQLSDSVVYTPELPGFVTGVAGFNPFATGIQTQRIRTFTHTASATAGYELTPLIDLTAGYTYSFLNFGSTFGTPIGITPIQGPLFRTTFQTVTAGPQIKVSQFDSVRLQYQYQKSDFNGGALPGFITQGGTVGYTHVFSPKVTASASAGALVFSHTNRMSFIGDLSMQYKGKNTITDFKFSRSVSPSFALVATSLESNLAAVTVTHHLTEPLSAIARVDYAYNTGVRSGSNLLFETYGALLSLKYQITRYTSGSFAYGHSKYRQDFQNLHSSFNRDQVTLTFRVEWR